MSSGPWLNFMSPHGMRWWVLREPEHKTAGDALNEVLGLDENRDYYGITYTVELVCIRQIPESERDWEHEIEETRYSDDDGAVEAWRVIVRDPS